MEIEKPPRILKILSRSLGILLAIAAVLVIRCSHLIMGVVEKETILGKILFIPQGTVVLKEFPPTFLFGFFLSILSMVLFGLSFPKVELSETNESDPTNQPHRPKDSLTVLSLISVFFFTILSTVVFYLVERKGIQGFLPVFYWALSIAIPSILLFIHDRKVGINVSVSLSKMEMRGLLLLTLILLCFYSSGFNSWKFSFVGDEYAYFWKAETIAEKGLTRSYWFNADGVYRVIPESLSTFHGIWIKFWGVGNANFGWRFGSSVLTLVCLIPLYLTIRSLLSRVSTYPRISALVGVSTFFLSELIIIWSRMGQQPNAGLFPIVFGICALLAGIKRSSLFYYFISGVSWGSGLIVNILGPIVAGGIILSLLFFLFVSQVNRSRTIRFNFLLPPLLVGCGLLIASLPNLVQSDYYEALNKQYLQSNEDPRTLGSRVIKTVQTNLMFLHFQAKDHFMSGDVVEPLTAVFIILGFGSWRRFGCKYWLMMIYSMTVFSFLTAGISHYAYLSVTRVLHVMFPFAIFVALGFDSILGKRKLVAFAFCIVTICWIFVYNTVKIEFFTPYQRPLEYISTFLRPVQEGSTKTTHVFVFPSDHDPYIARSMVKSYGYGDRVQLFQASPKLLEELNETLRIKKGPLSVHVMNTCPEKQEIKSLTDQNKEVSFDEFKRFDTPRANPAWELGLGNRIVKKVLTFVTLLEK